MIILIKYGKDKLVKRIKGARPVPLENVKTFKDIEDEITDFVRNGFKRVTKLVYQILMIFLVLILGSLSLLLAYHLRKI